MSEKRNSLQSLALKCLGVLAVAPLVTPGPASADFLGVKTVNKDDPTGLCSGTAVPAPPNQQVFSPLTVCNVYANFSDPADRLLRVGNANLQVFNGAVPANFFQHSFNSGVIAPVQFFVDFVAPDLICDTFVTIGYKIGPDPAGIDKTAPDGSFDAIAFAGVGHVSGGWFNGEPVNGQGDAATWPDLKVLFFQSSVTFGWSMSGVIDVFWLDPATGDTIAEVAQVVECAAKCTEGFPCDDGDPCTNPGPANNDICTDGVCTGVPLDCSAFGDDCNDGACVDGVCTTEPANNGGPCDDGDACNVGETCDDLGNCGGGGPLGCDDGNVCTDDGCDPASGCTHTDNNAGCDDGDACTSPDTCTGRCVRGRGLHDRLRLHRLQQQRRSRRMRVGGARSAGRCGARAEQLECCHYT